MQPTCRLAHPRQIIAFAKKVGKDGTLQNRIFAAGGMRPSMTTSEIIRYESDRVEELRDGQRSWLMARSLQTRHLLVPQPAFILLFVSFPPVIFPALSIYGAAIIG